MTVLRVTRGASIYKVRGENAMRVGMTAAYNSGPKTEGDTGLEDDNGRGSRLRKREFDHEELHGRAQQEDAVKTLWQRTVEELAFLLGLTEGLSHNEITLNRVIFTGLIATFLGATIFVLLNLPHRSAALADETGTRSTSPSQTQMHTGSKAENSNSAEPIGSASQTSPNAYKEEVTPETADEPAPTTSGEPQSIGVSATSIGFSQSPSLASQQTTPASYQASTMPPAINWSPATDGPPPAMPSNADEIVERAKGSNAGEAAKESEKELDDLAAERLMATHPELRQFMQQPHNALASTGMAK